MSIDVPSPIDLREMREAVDWESTATSKRPWRTEFFEAISDSLAGAQRVLELGSGPGFLAEHLLRSRPLLHLVLLDFSAAMHELARLRLGPLAARVQFLERDFKSDAWSKDVGTFDAVVTNQAVHELRHKAHAPALHRQVRALLRPSGTYLVSDHFAGEGGMSDSDLFMTVEEQRAALESAGFAKVDELLRKGGMVLHRAA
jgi:SAM-dependent methyltransferase